MKIIKGLINVLTTLIIAIGIVFISLYIIGIKPYVVLSGSMEPTISTGSLSFINKHIKYEDIKEKDIIAFKVNNKTLVTHRVYKIENNYFITKGDSNDEVDAVRVTKEKYIGKNIFSIAKLGYVVKAIQTTKGKIIIGTIIILLLVGSFLIGEPERKKKR